MTAMIDVDPVLSVRLARTPREVGAAQRLRYQIFVEELGASVSPADHAARLERDDFDPFFDHLLLIDSRRDPDLLQDVVGVYRLMSPEGYARAGRYYSDSEFDLTLLVASGRRLLELGRSCVHPDMRGGAGMFLLWNGLADYVLDHGIEVMFGTASFHGPDVATLARPLSLLHHFHRATGPLRVTARPAHRLDMNLMPISPVERPAAMALVPPLIKAYLRLGGHVSDGAWIDRGFNTVDVCLVMDTVRMSVKHRDFYTRKKGRDA